MIDGIRFQIDPEKAICSDVLEFHRKDENRKTAKYKGMIVELYPNRCYVRGSLHKYKNNGLNNENDFFLLEFISALNDLATSINFNPETTQFYTLEFGVNVELPFDAQKFIDSIVYCGGGNYSRSEIGVTITFSEWDIKIYLKEKKSEHTASNNLLRYEISINKTRRLKKITGGNEVHFVLSDLANPLIWRSFGDELLNVFDDIIVVDRDSIDLASLNNDEIKLFVNGCVPGYWLKKWEYQKKKKRELEKFSELIQKHSTSTMKNDVRSLIAEKINSLIDIQDVTISPFGKNPNNNENLSENHHLGNPNNNENLLRFHRLGNLSDDENLSENHHLGSEKIEAEKMKICPEITAWITGDFRTKPSIKNMLCEITNLPLPDGAKTSYLSDKGVEFYYENHREIYDEKLKVRLSKKWDGSELKIQFREIAHSIRNEKYNPKNNLKRDIKRMELKRSNSMFA